MLFSKGSFNENCEEVESVVYFISRTQAQTAATKARSSSAHPEDMLKDRCAASDGGRPLLSDEDLSLVVGAKDDPLALSPNPRLLLPLPLPIPAVAISVNTRTPVSLCSAGRPAFIDVVKTEDGSIVARVDRCG